MRKLFFLSSVLTILFVVSAFTGGIHETQNPSGSMMTTTKHPPLYAIFDADSFNCDPAEAKHHGRVHHRFNTLHMKEKGDDNIIVHFKSKKYTDAKGKHDNDYVHFDVLFDEGKTGPRKDTHLTLTWKGKKYHVKDDKCTFNITKLEWYDNHHFKFSADFSARVVTGGADTVSHVFQGKIVDEAVKSKTVTAHGAHK